ncbi:MULTISPECIES: hypothetical protein [unclassified Streptomyces]
MDVTRTGVVASRPLRSENSLTALRAFMRVLMLARPVPSRTNSNRGKSL